MKQVINSYITPGWPNVEVEYDRPIELFIDGFQGYDPKRNTFKILWVKEAEAISHFKKHVIENHMAFDVILTFDEEILAKCSNAHFMEFGTGWVKDYSFTEKKFQISHLTGNKEMAPGHLIRKKIHYKQEKIKNPKDFFISGYGGVENFANNKTLGPAKDALFESQFHICIENSQQKNYFTEKVVDCFSTKTIPIYWGCPNISDFFDVRGIYVANSFEEIMEICNSLNENSYSEKLEYVEKNFELCQKYITIIDRFEVLIKKILHENI